MAFLSRFIFVDAGFESFNVVSKHSARMAIGAFQGARNELDIAYQLIEAPAVDVLSVRAKIVKRLGVILSQSQMSPVSASAMLSSILMKTSVPFCEVSNR